MNRIHRKIWSKRLGAFVVVSEATSARGKSGGTLTAVAAAAFLASGAAMAQAAGVAAPTTLPSGGQVAAGQATITSQGAAMTINQGSQRAAINWQGFSIGKDASVQFNQPSSSAVILNRVVGSESSVIDGAMRANGKVYVVNPNGVLFGRDARVDVGGLVASTRAISDADFMQGRSTFSGTAQADVVNLGSISAVGGGYVALIGRGVKNDGVISANLGTVAGAAGNKVSLNFSGDSLVGITVDEGALNALVANGGAVRADGGQILMSAKTASALIDAVVNNTGELRAQTIAQKDGRILLLSDMEHGQTLVAGTLDASAPQGGKGGFIETSASKVTVAQATRVTTKASAGLSGTWLLDPTNFNIEAGSGSQTSSSIGASTLQAALASGNVIIQTQAAGSEAGDINVNAPFAWNANTLTLNAHGSIYVHALMDGSGTAQLEALYGQGAVALGNTARFVVTSTGKVNLPAGPNLTMALGSDALPQVFKVITALGTAGSTSASELQGLDDALNTGDYYALGADLDASVTTGWNSGAGFQPIGHSGGFYGGFEGLGHTITGLTINRPTQDYVGLFAELPEGGRIANLRLASVNITGQSLTGALLGDGGHDTVLDNITVSGTVTGTSSTGGILGRANDAGNIFLASTSSAAVSGSTSVGGAVGTYKGVMNQVVVSGNVQGSGAEVGGVIGSLNSGIAGASASGTVSGTSNVGGVIGMYDSNDDVTNLSSTGNVTGSGNNVGGVLGGLASNVSGNPTFTNFTSTGTVSGVNFVGGIAGSAVNIAASQASGAVTGSGSDVGGVAGLAYSVSNSSHASTVSGVNRVGGIAGTISEGFVQGVTSNTQVTGTGNQVGGLVGYLDGTATTGTATGNVQGAAEVGGAIGMATGAVTGIQASGSVTGSANRVGGAVGRATDSVSSSSATGNVAGLSFVGGLVGDAQDISDSQASGIVQGTTIVGGAAGRSAGVVSNVDATGAVTGSGAEVGGLIGRAGRTVTGSTAAGHVSGTSFVGGVIGMYDSNDDSDNLASTGNVVGTANSVGGVVGGMSTNATGNPTFTSLTSQGTVSGVNFVGGVAGSAVNIVSSQAAGVVTGSGSDVGGIAGLAYSVTNSSRAASVSGVNRVGGIAGTISEGFVQNVTSSSQVTGTGNRVGGLVGYLHGTLTTGTATGTVQGVSEVGGAVGAATGAITSVNAQGNVVGSSNKVGGAVGVSSSSISGSTAIGTVSGTGLVGGLVGDGNVVTTSSASGAVTGTGDSVGGLAGKANNTSQSQASGAVSGANGVGGLVGHNAVALTNSSATGNVTASGNDVGGVVGSTGWQSSVNGATGSGNVSGGSNVGGSVGAAWGSVSNVHGSGNITASGNNVGGALGYVYGNYTTGTASGTVTGAGNAVGGLAGNVTGTLTAGSATGNVQGAAHVGGLVGEAGAVTGSTASGTVAGAGDNVGGLGGNVGNVASSQASGATTSTGNNVGGLVGRANNIDQSQATGSVSGASNVGGLAGWAEASLTASSASGNVVATGSDVGGVVGHTGWQSTVNGATGQGAVSGVNNVGGSVGAGWGSVSNVHGSGNVTASGNNAGGAVGFVYGNLTTGTATGAVSGNSSVGGLAGVVTGITSGASASGNVTATGEFAGGLVGDSGGINNSQASGDVVGTRSVGGAAGRLAGSSANFSATGDVSGTDIYVGGLVGIYQGNNSISNASASGNVTSTGDAYTGGLVGYLGWNSTLTNASATGAVSGVSYVGGLLGWAYGNVSNSWSSGAVTGQVEQVGGLIGGWNNALTLTNSFYNLDAVTVTVGGQNRSADVTLGGIYANQYSDWVTGGRQALSAANYLTADSNGAYQLSSTSDLRNWLAFAGTPGLSYVMTTDIDLSGMPGWHVPVLRGSLDGAYHVFTNLQNSQPYNDRQGLIGLLGSAGSIERVGVTGNVAGYEFAGGLVGDQFGPISESFASVNVAGKWYVGGLVGDNETSTITDSYSTGTVTGRDVGSWGVGGLVGENDSTITNSYSSSVVTCVVSGCDAYGGLVGATYGTETDSFAVTDFTGANVTDPSNGTNAPGETFISAAQSMQAAGYAAANWSIADAGGSSATWRIYAGQTAPLLRGFLQPLTVTAVSGGTRQYDGTTAFGGAVSYSAAPDPAKLLGTASVTSGSANVGTHTLTASGLYSAQVGYDISYAAGTGSITPRQLTITGSQVVSRPYDGTTAVSVTNGTLVGLVGGESLVVSSVGTVDSPNAGNRSATVTYGLANGVGGLASNYSISPQVLTALITPKVLTVTGTTAANKVYDGTTAAQVSPGALQGLVGSETLGLSGIGTFDSKNAGQRTVTAAYTAFDGSNGGLASNYVVQDSTGLIASITPRTLNVGFTVATRAYDGTTGASTTALDDRVAGDQLGVSFVSAFSDPRAGQNKPVAISQLALQGPDAGNYVMAAGPASGTIAPRQLSIAGSVVNPKEYDGTTNALVTSGILQGLVAGEDLTVSSSAQLADRNAGARTATVTYVLGNGTSGIATDYVLPAELLPALVNPKLLTITGTAASGKVYDGTTVGTVTPGVLQGLVGSETLGISGIGEFDSKNVGQRSATARYTLTDGSGGGLASNYVIGTTPGLQATITPRDLRVVFSVTPRQYDATTQASAAAADDRVAGDALQLGYTASFRDPNAAANKPVDISQFVLSGPDAGNYNPVLTPATGTIDPRRIDFTLTRTDPSKIYTADGKPQVVTADLDKLVSSSWRNAVGQEVPGTLTYTLWKDGVQVSEAVLPGIYEIRAEFSPASGNYALGTDSSRWPRFALAPEAMPDIISAAQRTLPTIAATLQPATRPSIELASTPINVVSAPSQVLATFGEGTNLLLIGAPAGGEVSQAVSMSQAAQMLGTGGTATGTDVRVPLGRNSLVTLVNGGVRLPEQVDQLLFVVGDNGNGNKSGERESGKDEPGAPGQGRDRAPAREGARSGS